MGRWRADRAVPASAGRGAAGAAAVPRRAAAGGAAAALGRARAAGRRGRGDGADRPAHAAAADRARAAGDARCCCPGCGPACWRRRAPRLLLAAVGRGGAAHVPPADRQVLAPDGAFPGQPVRPDRRAGGGDDPGAPGVRPGLRRVPPALRRPGLLGSAGAAATAAAATSACSTRTTTTCRPRWRPGCRAWRCSPCWCWPGCGRSRAGCGATRRRCGWGCSWPRCWRSGRSPRPATCWRCRCPAGSSCCWGWAWRRRAPI